MANPTKKATMHVPSQGTRLVGVQSGHTVVATPTGPEDAPAPVVDPVPVADHATVEADAEVTVEIADTSKLPVEPVPEVEAPPIRLDSTKKHSLQDMNRAALAAYHESNSDVEAAKKAFEAAFKSRRRRPR